MTAVESIAPVPLAEALDFTPEDLAANRAGRLSQVQAARLARIRRRQLVIAVVGVGVLIIVAALFLFLGRNGDVVFTAMGGALSVMNAAIVGFSTQGYLRYQADTTRPPLVTEAVLQRVIRVAGRSYAYVLRVPAEPGARAFELRVNKTVFNAFEEGRRCRLYRSAGSRALLTAEQV